LRTPRSACRRRSSTSMPRATGTRSEKNCSRRRTHWRE
jgi:hypothetical protein